MNPKNILKGYWKSILVISAIIYLSFASPKNLVGSNFFTISDKLAHFLMYMALTVVLIYDFWRNNRSAYQTKIFLLVCCAFPILLGGAIEIIQEYFFEPRTGEWLDWLANTGGVLVALFTMTAFGYLFFKNRERKKNKS